MCYIRWQAALIQATVAAGMLLSYPQQSIAQLRPVADETLGSEGSVVVPFDPENLVDRIDGGARRGDNLFHSFEVFHVDSGRGVYFTDPGVENILGRVTGGVSSQVLGVLGVLGEANLFLINPEGIVFGEGARLDIDGSFTATTADSIQFGEQGQFAAVGNSVDSGLLTVQPSAFLFNQMSPAAIVNHSQSLPPTVIDGAPRGGLRVADGEGITLLGGDVSLDNGGLSALGGHIELGGLSESGTIMLSADGSLEFPTGVARSNVLITNGSRLSASDSIISGGSISITADLLEITNGSGVSAGTVGGSSFVEGSAGDITLDASSIQVVSSVIDNVVRGSNGNGGDVLITADEVSISGTVAGRSVVQSTLLGEGSTGKVKIDARDRVTIDRSLIFSNIGGADRSTVAVGSGGNITITTPTLLITRESALQSTTFGQGDAGSIIINASEQVTVENNSILRTFSTAGVNTIAAGNGGDIEITAPVLSVVRSLLDSSTFSEGDAGSVIIDVSDQAILEDSSILSTVGGIGADAIAIGNGGDIEITAPVLSLMRSELNSSTFSEGNAGSITIDASDQAIFDNSSLFSNVDSVATGNSGNIYARIGSLLLTNGALFVTATSGQGNAGDVTIDIQERMTVDNSNIISNNRSPSTDTGERRDAGDITITTGSLDLIDSGQLQSITFGQGDAGNVAITARDYVSIEGFREVDRSIYNSNSYGSIEGFREADRGVFKSAIFAITGIGAQGRGGDVEIIADSVQLDSGGTISASTLSPFSGGEITIEANTFEATNGGQVVSSASRSGSAGNINLDITDSVTLSGSTSLAAVNRGDLFSGLFANTNRSSTGASGTIQLATETLQVTDQARIEVDGQGSQIAGNIDLVAEAVRLDNGRLTAETAVVNGGNIILRDARLLLLRSGSLISTTAGTDDAGGNGGNINIDADIVAAVLGENSDIRANAFSGNGGVVEIDSQGVFGIAVQPQDNPLTSDITVSSNRGVQGAVDITTPETDLESGLTELPVAFLNASNQITQACSGSEDDQGGEFIVTGRGGLPSSPTDVLVGDESLVGWAVLGEPIEVPSADGESDQMSIGSAHAEWIPSEIVPIVEAQGWTKDEKGEVTLVTVVPTDVTQPSVACDGGNLRSQSRSSQSRSIER
ncbi:filamentous hemagglutinin N-terminal domain-containing protein [cf. Phormidesmis sp. LEGE 11477]|uniref:two-partner secretion domain-containing protein n=1 Tax=cf. Phormidesmis sp. LEGE 11477 TaxID=1828680 RepID=UPI001882A356|nr:filamentous hemagglutinin N-terminal domain-containing protein [cf. Phormidesmis sp. LEGE 11477]MBE9060497.1 filamentous hemagglutinin N-terminal domain-containing protein [cf. Phormidesmis sp. LEGE 11477]